jgi:hypothetical protein
MAKHQRDGGKEQLWRDLLERQAISGLSIRKCCQRRRLTESNFYAWRLCDSRPWQSARLFCHPPAAAVGSIPSTTLRAT